MDRLHFIINFVLTFFFRDNNFSGNQSDMRIDQ